jgi:hypothetical protein
MTDLRAQIDNAAARHAADTAKLQREDGSRRYSPDEHQERVQAIDSRFREEVDGIRETVQAEISQAEARVERIQGGDPLDDLSPDELSAAGARASFVREEVQGLDAERLRARLGAVLAASDKPTKAVYFHYLRRRVLDDPALGIALSAELSTLEETLGRGPAPREAQEKLEALRETHDYAGLKRSGFSNVLDRHFTREYGSPGVAVRR